jgi:hypothetical protein
LNTPIWHDIQKELNKVSYLVQQTGRVAIGHGSDTCYSYNSSKIEKSVATFATQKVKKK